jgi:hypothetical protein
VGSHERSTLDEVENRVTEPTVTDDGRVSLERLRGRFSLAPGGPSRGWWLLVVPVVAITVFGLTRLGGGGTMPTAALPATVDGLTVMTVSEVLAARDEGGLHEAPVALGGYWSDGSMAHGCAAPDGPTGELEYYCHDGEFGITELDEPIMVIDRHGYVTEPRGPHLTPWFPNELPGFADLVSLPIINGQRYRPVPIVVVGHFDDPRAEACRPEALELCLDRLVVDRIAIFDIESVPTPGVTPTPTPFPSPAPSGLFAPKDCAGGGPYSFIGWTTTAELGLSIEREGHIWAVITVDPVLLGGPDWNDDPNGSGHKWRWWGRLICIGEEGQPGSMQFQHVAGTSYREWDDGRHTPGEP